MAMKARAILLDKDGTLIVDVPYNVDPARIRLADGAGAGLRLLRDAGFEIVVVSNQAGVATGRFPESALADVARCLRDLLRAEGVRLRGFLYCPHHPNASVMRYRVACDCRKPAPGLLRRAAALFELDLSRSWMVGDTLDDVEAGRRAGCRAVLVDNGGETEWVPGPDREPHFTIPNLRRAASAILAYEHERARVRRVRETLLRERACLA